MINLVPYIFTALKGPEKVECGPDGHWDGETACKEISCSVELPYGQITEENCVIENLLKMDSACAFECPAGQKGTSDKVTCSKDLKGLENEVEVRLVIPECQEITCKKRSPAGEKIEVRDRMGLNEITGGF